MRGCWPPSLALGFGLGRSDRPSAPGRCWPALQQSAGRIRFTLSRHLRRRLTISCLAPRLHWARFVRWHRDSVEIRWTDDADATRLAFNVLQAAGVRITKTEFVACPGCGRTLFELKPTTDRIKSRTGHLVGVKIAVMGCIVNGPGEMADADFGYVGGAPGKVNLYVGKECVERNVPQDNADDRLIALIKEHGRWTEPPES